MCSSDLVVLGPKSLHLGVPDLLGQLDRLASFTIDGVNCGQVLESVDRLGVFGPVRLEQGVSNLF